MIYGHSESPTWQPFTRSHQSHHHRIPPKDTFSMLIVLALKKGEIHPVRHTTLPTRRSCRLRRFTVPHKHSMWLVLFNSWFKGQPRTGLNRHRRGYAIEEAASGVHFQDVGSYWARLVSYFNIKFHHLYCISTGSIFLRTRECQKHSTSIESIALSKAYDPNILVIREYQGIGKTILTHASRYQTIPINLNA